MTTAMKLPVGTTVHVFSRDRLANRERKCQAAQVVEFGPDSETRLIVEVRGTKQMVYGDGGNLTFAHSSGLVHEDGVDTTHLRTRQRERMMTWHEIASCPGPVPA